MTDVKCSYLGTKYRCKLLHEKCLGSISNKDHCNFIDHYKYVKNRHKMAPFATEVKESMYDGFMKEWQSYAKDRESGRKPGKKNMTGGPLERAVRKVLIEKLTPYGACIRDKAKEFTVWQDVPIKADCLIEKGEHQNIISVKTYLGAEQIRETFAYAYLAKAWKGQRCLKVYEVGLFILREEHIPFVDACKPYLDGVYSLSSEPYFDKLVQKIQKDLKSYN